MAFIAAKWGALTTILHLINEIRDLLVFLLIALSKNILLGFVHIRFGQKLNLKVQHKFDGTGLLLTVNILS